MITELAYTVYPVADAARARAFYEGVLDLKLAADFDGKWLEYELGAGVFALTTMMGEGRRGTLSPSVAFEVDDFDAAVAKLREAGVKFTMEPFATPVCRMAVVADPDGNELIIHRRNG
jgi:predicted enzyme related to lactoylglutathione lyase